MFWRNNLLESLTWASKKKKTKCNKVMGKYGTVEAVTSVQLNGGQLRKEKLWVL